MILSESLALINCVSKGGYYLLELNNYLCSFSLYIYIYVYIYIYKLIIYLYSIGLISYFLTSCAMSHFVLVYVDLCRSIFRE